MKEREEREDTGERETEEREEREDTGERQTEEREGEREKSIDSDER